MLCGREETNKMSGTMKKFLFDIKCRTLVWGKWRLEQLCCF